MRYGKGGLTPSNARRRAVQRFIGVALTMAGAFIVTTLFVVVFSNDPVLAALGLDLGLAFATTISAAGQIVFLIGLWLVWSARSSRPWT